MKEMNANELKKIKEFKLKIVKYILDVLSSYNNSSLKNYLGGLNPKLVGLYTFFSSCIGMYIMWMWTQQQQKNDNSDNSLICMSLDFRVRFCNIL